MGWVGLKFDSFFRFEVLFFQETLIGYLGELSSMRTRTRISDRTGVQGVSYSRVFLTPSVTARLLPEAHFHLQY